MMEFMGSFAIIFFGNWAQIFSDLGMSNQIAVSLVIGLFMTVFTWVGTDISGAHYNPITTVRNVLKKPPC
jgi:glycerol uptake facilitator-like aquaporin